jgi:deazaflavin-dependent oxidoreductase (nitroreductase family)
MPWIKLGSVAYLKPPWFTAKIFNPIAMATGVANSETLTVTKRGSKQPQKVPVLTVDVDGVKYLVSTRGESQWVKNVRADPNVTITNKGGTTRYTAHEVPAQDRQPILTAYRAKAGRTVEGYFRKLPHEADHPVFSLTPS